MSIPTGFRTMSPGIDKSLRIADQWGHQTAVSKARAVLAFNKTAKLLGISAQGRELINLIASFTRDMDWEGDSRPIAWPDNQSLMEQTGLSKAALKRNLRVLSEAGLLAFKDSPNGRRVGRRNPHTNKIMLDRTYGLDLSPLGVRTPELEQLAVEERQRAEHTRNLAHRFTCNRKMLTSILEAATHNDIPGPWESCANDLAELALLRKGRCDALLLETLCTRITALLERAQTAYTAAADGFNTKQQEADTETRCNKYSQYDIKMSPKGLISEPPIQNTTKNKNLHLYNEERQAAKAAQLDLLGAGKPGEEGFGKKPHARLTTTQIENSSAKPINLNTIRLLCPEFWQFVYTKNGAPTWDDVIVTAAEPIRSSLQIPDSTWRSAAKLLGRQNAAIAVAIIFEKHAQGLIETPGAYLNGMIKKAESSLLHLPSSLFHWRSPRKSGKEFPQSQ